MTPGPWDPGSVRLDPTFGHRPQSIGEKVLGSLGDTGMTPFDFWTTPTDRQMYGRQVVFGMSTWGPDPVCRTGFTSDDAVKKNAQNLVGTPVPNGKGLRELKH